MYTTVQKSAVSHFENLIIMSIKGTSMVWKTINKGKKLANAVNLHVGPIFGRNMRCLPVSGKPVIIAQNVCWMSGRCLCSAELLVFEEDQRVCFALHVLSPHRR